MDNKIVTVIVTGVIVVLLTSVILYSIPDPINTTEVFQFHQEDININITWSSGDTFLNLSENTINSVLINITNNKNINKTLPTTMGQVDTEYQLITPINSMYNFNTLDLGWTQKDNLTIKSHNSTQFESNLLLYWKLYNPDIFQYEGIYTFLVSINNTKSGNLSFYYKGENYTEWNGTFDNDYCYIGHTMGFSGYYGYFVIFEDGTYYRFTLGIRASQNLFNQTITNITKPELTKLMTYIGLEDYLRDYTGYNFNLAEKGHVDNETDNFHQIFSNVTLFDSFKELDIFYRNSITTDHGTTEISINQENINHKVGVYAYYDDNNLDVPSFDIYYNYLTLISSSTD